MALKYLYIDESGDLGFSDRSSKVLVISALLVNDMKPLDRIIKNMRRNKFRKELMGASEIKANKSSSEMRKYMIRKLNQTSDVSAFHNILLKPGLPKLFHEINKDQLYDFISGNLAEQIVIDGSDIEIRVDKSKGKQLLRDDFNTIFVERLKEDSTIGRLEIHHSQSEAFTGLQFADLLAWSVFQKYSRGNTEYTDLISFTNRYNILSSNNISIVERE